MTTAPPPWLMSKQLAVLGMASAAVRMARFIAALPRLREHSRFDVGHELCLPERARKDHR